MCIQLVFLYTNSWRFTSTPLQMSQGRTEFKHRGDYIFTLHLFWYFLVISTDFSQKVPTLEVFRPKRKKVRQWRKKCQCMIFLVWNLIFIPFPKYFYFSYHILTFSRLMTYICRTSPLTSRCCILYTYSTNIRTEYFKHATHSPFFSSSKCHLFHNAIFFGFCIIHILNTGCAKIEKKIPAPRG